MMSLIESCRPKPVSSSAVHPAMPAHAMRKRRLYLKILRAVTFQRNDIRRHKGGMRSIRMRLPARGARGSISAAGVSTSVERTTSPVAANVMPTQSTPDRSAMPGSIGVGMTGMS